MTAAHSRSEPKEHAACAAMWNFRWPKKVSELFDEWMLWGERKKEAKFTYADIVKAMKQSLADIDKKIEDLVS